MSAVSLLRSRLSIWFKRWVIVTMIAILVVNPGTRTPRVHAQSPAGAGFVLDAGDLRFIFHQIEIAEAHSAGGQLFGSGPLQVNEVRLPFGLRTVDGSFNHLETGFVDTTKFGASDQTFPRMTTPTFRQAETLTFDDGPGGVDVGEQTSYDQRNGAVVDSQPRVISNLIVDQRSTSNPAVAALVNDPLSGNEVIDPVTGLAFIPNVAPDVGLSAPFNVMFTFFGQFFDHGLDLVNKGGNGTVFVPLNADDPLVLGPDGIPGTPDDLPPSRRFMVLTRGTMLPGPDNILGTDDDIHEGTNQTTPFVDQNQTYTSHPSHQVFLREYVLEGGRPVSNGKMIDGVGGHIGNWGEIKQQAAQMLGIALSDLDVVNVPLLETDLYGYFKRVPNGNGLPQVRLAGGGTFVPPVVDNPATPANEASPLPANALRTGHAFLDDIAHHARPSGDHDNNPATPDLALTPDADLVAGPDDHLPNTYDNELLDAHFVTGDGRGNENIALTAVHTIFHSEHNRLALQIGGVNGVGGLIDTLLTSTEAAAWRNTTNPSGWTYGERVFQAAKFVTEMQYQHLAGC